MIGTLIQDTLAIVNPLPAETAIVDSLVLSNQAIKTILQATENDSSFPDWIQAISAIIAAVGVVWTLYDLVKSSKGQNKQLAAFTTIAKSQNKQIELLTDQIQELRKQTDIYKGIHNNSSQDLRLKLEKEEAEKNNIKKVERERIKPNFITTNSLVQDKHIYRITLINSGNEAYNFNVRDESKQNYLTCFVKQGDTEWKANEMPTVNVKSKGELRLDISVNLLRSGGLDAEQAFFSFILEFEDALGNRYRQKIGRRKETKQYFYTDPYLIAEEVAL